MRLRSCEKAMGSCTAQCKMLLFCANTIVRESAKFELADLKKEEEEKRFWRFGDGIFMTVLHNTGSLLGQENTIVSCHKGLYKLYAARFEFSRKIFFCISIYCVSALSLHIDCTESMILLLVPCTAVMQVMSFQLLSALINSPKEVITSLCKPILRIFL